MILLDEIEKAHTDVFNLLLQILDDGRLTDGQGRTVDFKNTVVIMTSNLGSDFIQEQHGDASYDSMKEHLMGLLLQTFRPELINRIDETVVFHPLNLEQIKNIAQLQLEGLLERMRQKEFDVEVTPTLLEKIAKAGFDPVFGARPLRRAIQNKVEDPLAKAILAGDILPSEPLMLDADEKGLVVKKR